MLIQINFILCQTIKSTLHALTLNISRSDWKYPINYSDFNEQGDISIKAMGNSWWMGFCFWSTNKMHGEEQSEKKTTLPNGPQIDGQIPKA